MMVVGLIINGYAAPSFNCKLSKTKIEKAICAHESLASLDITLSQNYKSVAQSSDDEGRSLLKTDQKQWVSERNSNCATGAEQCLKKSYENRIAQLQLMASKENVVRAGTREELEGCIKAFSDPRRPYKTNDPAADFMLPNRLLPDAPRECGYAYAQRDGSSADNGLSIFVGDINNDGKAEYTLVTRCGGSSASDGILEVFQKQGEFYVPLYFNNVLEKSGLDSSRLPLNIGRPLLVRGGTKNRIFFRSPVEFWTWEGDKLSKFLQ